LPLNWAIQHYAIWERAERENCRSVTVAPRFVQHAPVEGSSMAATSSGRDPVEELAEEFLDRLRQGEHPTAAEYAERYPAFADAILTLFPAMAEIERGGMGIVYEAEQVSLGRRVALKVLPQHAVLDPRRLERFRREARSAARLLHSNIVPVFGVGEHDGLPYFVMQFIPGLGLDAVLRELRRLRGARGGSDQEPGDGGGPTPTALDRMDTVKAVARTLLEGGDTPQPGPHQGAPNPAGPELARSETSAVHLPGQPEGTAPRWPSLPQA
jgi:Protein tyrosine and serine/threonine kinase